jgi:hypothetical protein
MKLSPDRAIARTGGEPAVYFLVPLIVWTIYWLAFYPAIMTPDSVWQWEQVETLELNDVHPAFHTLTLWLATRPWTSPAAAAFLQVLLFSLVSAWGLTVLRREGLPRAAAGLVLVLLCLHPANGFIAVTLWKRLYFSLICLALTVFLLRAYRRPVFLQSRRGWTVLGLLLAGLALYAHNGILVAGLLCPWLILVFRKYSAPVIKAAGLALAVLIVVKAVLFPALGVERNRRAFLPLVHQVAACIDRGVEFTDQEKAFLDSLCSLEDNWHYSPYTIQGTMFSGRGFDFARLDRNRGEFLKIWWKAARQHPGIILEHQLAVTAFLWQPLPSRQRNLATVEIGIAQNSSGWEPSPILPGWRDKLIAYKDLTHRVPYFWLVWRLPPYLYAALAVIIAICLRERSWGPEIIGGPVRLNTVSLLLSAPSRNFRYQYPLVMVFPFILACLFLKWRPAEPLPEPGESEN